MPRAAPKPVRKKEPSRTLATVAPRAPACRVPVTTRSTKTAYPRARKRRPKASSKAPRLSGGRERVAGTATKPRNKMPPTQMTDRKSTRLNSSHVKNSYAVFCLKKKNNSNMILEFNFNRTSKTPEKVQNSYRNEVVACSYHECDKSLYSIILIITDTLRTTYDTF